MGGCSGAYSNTALPSSSAGFTGPTVFGFWDDLYLTSGTAQSVYYATSGTAPNRQLIFEYYTGLFGNTGSLHRFQIVFSENSPGIVIIRYYQATSRGASATIGVQRKFAMM